MLILALLFVGVTFIAVVISTLLKISFRLMAEKPIPEKTVHGLEMPPRGKYGDGILLPISLNDY